MTRPLIPPFLALALAACGGKITSGLPDDTGTGTDGGATDGGTADGGTADGGTGDGGGTDGGTSGTDEDGDGWTVEAGDCDDDDETVYPNAPEECYDGVDADCDEVDDNDCDGDGYYPTDLGGEDCDDTDENIYPGALETRADGKDNDCDDAVDEDAYCNVYAPMSNESDAYRTYDTFFLDGMTYIESSKLEGYAEAAGTVTHTRILDDGAGGGMTIKESWACDGDGQVTVTGYVVNSYGFDLSTVSFTAPSIRALSPDLMVEGATWDISYDAVEASSGTLWTVQGTATVLPQDNITIVAGIFATTPIQVDYTITDYSSYFGDRSGKVTWYVAPGVGVVYSEDILSDGTVAETRELNSYGGFFSVDPADY